VKARREKVKEKRKWGREKGKEQEKEEVGIVDIEEHDKAGSEENAVQTP